MEETYYLIYNCYGLSCKSGNLSEMAIEKSKLLELEKTEAATDGRKIKFYFLCKKEDFMSLIAKIMH